MPTWWIPKPLEQGEPPLCEASRFPLVEQHVHPCDHMSSPAEYAQSLAIAAMTSAKQRCRGPVMIEKRLAMPDLTIPSRTQGVCHASPCLHEALTGKGQGARRHAIPLPTFLLKALGGSHVSERWPFDSTVPRSPLISRHICTLVQVNIIKTNCITTTAPPN